MDEQQRHQEDTSGGVPDAVAELIVRYHDNALGQAGLSELREGLTQSEAARALFVRWGVHGELLSESLSADYQEQGDDILQGSPRVLAELAKLEQQAQASMVELHELKPPWYRKPWAITAGSLAAGLAIALVLVAVLVGPSDSSRIADEPDDPAPVLEAPTAVVATLTAERNARWDRHPGQGLYAGQRFTLAQGFAEITTNRGAIAILEAPTTIELINNNALRLHTGKLVGICETESSKGLLVRTSNLDLTDLGTRFGVVVQSDGSTLAEVFAGSISVKRVTKEAGVTAPRVLSADQSVAFDAVGQEIPPEQFADVVFTPERLRQSVIVSVKLRGIEEFEPRVIPQGFWDGQKIFSDRKFVFTGIAAGGVPAQLQGADIVQMPGDARSRISAVTDFQLEVDLAQPSDVYLLISERQPEPGWLTRDYASTGEDVGVRFSEGRTDRYTIWKRKTIAVGKAVVAEALDIAMYGVVVVPRPSTEPGQP